MRAASVFIMVLASTAFLAGTAQAKMERAYIGTFTATPGRAPQTGNRAAGIYATDLDTVTGKLTTPRLVATTASPSWLVMDRARGVLFAVNEYGGFTDPKTNARGGSISAFRIDKASGGLTPINVQAAATSTNLALDASGNWLLACSYADGVATVLPVAADGTIGEAGDTFKPTGPREPDQAADQPPGNQLPSNHQHSRVHGVAFHPGGKYVVLDDAGLDTISVFTFDAGKLSLVKAYPQVPGSTPRHSVWDAKGRNLYTVFEQDMMVSVQGFDPATGVLTERQRLSTLPPGFGGSASASEVVLGKDGRNLYVANRFHDSIAHFNVLADGTLKYVSDTLTGTNVPRLLSRDPSGRYIFAGGQNNDSIASFRLDVKTGAPKSLNLYAPVLSPASMVFVDP